MHTIMVIGIGIVVLAAMLLPAHLAGASRARAARWFIPVWLCGALINLWIGVTTAGYTVLQEAPIAAVVFGVPAVLAWWLSR